MDYQKIGLKVGLEIHQQLESGTKLFCRCPIKKSDEFPLVVKRKIRPVAGETGYIDQAALHAFLQHKLFFYRFHPESSCLVELDEDPPKELNPSALHIGIQVAKMLKSTLVDEVHVMRKTIVDGSAVSGFQRTALLALGGELATSFGKVRIETICLEEDAATPLEKQGDMVEYRIDRLGVPLIEIATAPDMDSPEKAKEVAEKLGLLLRSVSVVRGIGSIRQDVNVSIRNGERIEIKGFQELAKIPKAVENEALRQQALLEIREELHKRGAQGIEKKPTNVTKLFSQTKNKFISKIIQAHGIVYAGKLEKFAGLLKHRVGDRTLGKELSSYAQVYGLGIMHSDEDIAAYELEAEFREVRSALKAAEHDVMFLVAGVDAVDRAFAAVIGRAEECMRGVPKETRVADGEGSKFTRPLPGSGRMYPESDIRPVHLTHEFVNTIQKPKTLLEKKEELKLPEELANQIIRSKLYPVYEELAENYDPVLVASTLLSTMRDLKREGYSTEAITIEHLDQVFAAIQAGTLAKGSLKEVFMRICNGEAVDAAVEAYALMSDSELESMIQDILKAEKDQKIGMIMKRVMEKSKGRADGKKVSEMVKKYSTQ